MQEQDRPQFAQLITEALGFYRQDVSEFQLEIWWESMRRFELQDVRKAMSYHIQNPDRGQFPPRPADITRFLSGGSTDRALRAWSRVERALRHVGPYKTIIFDDPIIHRVLEEMGGWIDVCETSTEKDLDFKGQEFRTRYQGYAVRRPEEWSPQLIGYVEQDCRAHGYEPPEPVIYGDQQKALQVHEQGRGRRQGAIGLSQVRENLGVQNKIAAEGRGTQGGGSISGENQGDGL